MFSFLFYLILIKRHEFKIKLVFEIASVYGAHLKLLRRGQFQPLRQVGHRQMQRIATAAAPPSQQEFSLSLRDFSPLNERLANCW